ncbi:MAG: EamA family transporter [Anaerolineales bacterium]|jgi:drug/metabolite transporter (DMT)-like permease
MNSIQNSKASIFKNLELLTLFAFVGIVIFGGSNAVAVRFSNFDLPPFWGAALRFGTAAVLFWVVTVMRGVQVPRGRALVGVVIYGALTVGISYAFLYWALQFIQASLTMVIGALGPLFTFFFALAHGQENFRWKGLIGALMAFGGILLGIGDQIGQVESLLPILAVVVGFAAASEGTVLYKSFPKSDPLAVNAISFTTGTVMLAVISLIARETWRLPETQEAWFAYGYLVLGGSFALFYLVLYVLNRWTASATSYAFLLFPVVTIILGSWLANEVISGRFLLGAVIVLLGVWVGTIADPENI